MKVRNENDIMNNESHSVKSNFHNLQKIYVDMEFISQPKAISLHKNSNVDKISNESSSENEHQN